jgi:hypothetical protein
MRWKMPVFVGTGNRLTRTVVGPREAIEYMKNSFHFKDGDNYANALTACHDEVAGRIGPAIARKLFLTAFVRDSVRSSMRSKKSHSIAAVEAL